MKLLLLSLLLLLVPVGCAARDDLKDADFARGVDVSLLQHVEDGGVIFRNNGRPRDPLQMFKRQGVNYVRLRLFVDPDGSDGQVNTLPYTLALAKRVKKAGLRFLLDLHYSDEWADPKSQHIPKAWRGLTTPALAQQVRDYTRQTVLAFHERGCMPDMVQVGNEIANGMLWPVGGPLGDATKWEPFAELVQAGIAGVRDASAAAKTKVPPIMIHAHAGDDATVCRWFFDGLRERGVTWDVIGLSYYPPLGNKPLGALATNLAMLAERYETPIIVVETAYSWDGGDPSLALPYPVSPAGQRAYLDELIRIIRRTPNGRGAGVFYWAPDWIMHERWNGPTWSNQWEERALFDRTGNALPALDALGGR